MHQNELANLLVVLAACFFAPFLHHVVRRTRVPAVVVEIVVGMLIGPQLFHLASVDSTVSVVSRLGLSVLLYLAGSEVDLRQLAGPVGKKAGVAFAGSLGLAAAVGYTLKSVGVVNNALLVAVILTATSLGIVVPVLRDNGGTRSPIGQFVLAGAAIGYLLAQLSIQLMVFI